MRSLSTVKRNFLTTSMICTNHTRCTNSRGCCSKRYGSDGVSCALGQHLPDHHRLLSLALRLLLEAPRHVLMTGLTRTGGQSFCHTRALFQGVEGDVER